MSQHEGFVHSLLSDQYVNKERGAVVMLAGWRQWLKFPSLPWHHWLRGRTGIYHSDCRKPAQIIPNGPVLH